MKEKTNTLIIDNHAHIFSFLGSNSEYSIKDLQIIYSQKLISDHHEPIKRSHDYEIVVDDNMFLDNKKLGPDGRCKLNFRVGKFGKYEWTKNNVEYFKQYMSIGLQEMIAPPGFMITQMDHIYRG